MGPADNATFYVLSGSNSYNFFIPMEIDMLKLLLNAFGKNHFNVHKFLSFSSFWSSDPRAYFN